MICVPIDVLWHMEILHDQEVRLGQFGHHQQPVISSCYGSLQTPLHVHVSGCGVHSGFVMQAYAHTSARWPVGPFWLRSSLICCHAGMRSDQRPLACWSLLAV